jgi:MATE family multidrug resistance protein
VTDLALPATPRAWHRRVWQLSWPVVAANATIPLVGLVDTAVMGRMPGPAFVGAVAIGATIFNALYWIFGFLRMGTTGLAAQALGGDRPSELAAVALRSAALAVLLGALALLLQSPLHGLMLEVFPASQAVERLASTYFLIRIWGAPALMLHMVVLGMLFGLQRVRATLGLSILLNVTNVGLDLLLVIGLDWGVAGVATATVISEWLVACVGIVLLYNTLRGRAAALVRGQLWQREPLLKLFGISGNLLVRSFFVQLPFFVFTLLGASLGDLVLAANAIIMQLFMAMAFVLDGPAHTAETLCGYAYGAGNQAGLRRAAHYSRLWALALAVLLALLIALAGPTFVGWLTLLPEVREAARALLPWAMAGPLVAVWAFHYDGVFIGTTRTAALRNSMFLAALAYLLVIWIGLERLGNTALWLAMMVFMAVRGLLLAFHYPRILDQLPHDPTGNQEP